jgi:hypothetical protein
VLRQTVRRRLLAQLQEVKTELRRRMHLPIPEQGAYVRSVVGGHLRYFGVPRNGPAIRLFHQGVGRLSHRVLLRRSQTHCLPWCRMRRYITRWLPPARICHPSPLVRLGVVTQGRRRMQSCCMSGSVEGVMGNHASYSDYGSAPPYRRLSKSRSPPRGRKHPVRSSSPAGLLSSVTRHPTPTSHSPDLTLPGNASCFEPRLRPRSFRFVIDSPQPLRYVPQHNGSLPP